MMRALQHLVETPGHIAGGIAYHLGGALFTAKPRMVQFPICDRCNARCIMCNRWQKKGREEISLQKIREVFQSDLFTKVEEVCIHGGEPTLRRDLADICRTIEDSCPRMQRMWISTNGLAAKQVEKRIREVLAALTFSRIEVLEVNVSLDGIEETHDKIRGVKGGYRQAVETIRVLKQLEKDHPIKTSIGTVMQPLNLEDLDHIRDLGRTLEVDVQFQPLMFDKFFNVEGTTDLRFTESQRQRFQSFVESELATGASTTSFYWCAFLSMLKGGARGIPCAFDRYVLSLYPTGEVLPCSREEWIMFGNVHEEAVGEIWYGEKARRVRRRMKKEVCPGCTFYCAAEFSLRKEFFKYLAFFLGRKLLGRSQSGGSARPAVD